MRGQEGEAVSLTERDLDPRMEVVGDSRFSRFPDNRMPCSCDECHGEHFLKTRAEWNAWATENMPNGQCICYPERGIVCGAHDGRPRGWAKSWHLPWWWPARIAIKHEPRMDFPNGVWLSVMDQDDVFDLSVRLNRHLFSIGIYKWWDDD